ncbi:MAG TPA: MOSC N-terminal beta barrel domain-containing protein [Planctomycetota bacterium]|nr:MOSC N-terminal beta barrel domain-containing protein [Planctomycetota bacterium]
MSIPAGHSDPNSTSSGSAPVAIDHERLAQLRAKTAVVRRINLFPIKSIEGFEIDRIAAHPNGGLQADRRYAFFSQTHGGWIRAKDFPQLLRIRARFDLPRNTVSVATEAGGREFDLALERPAFNDWMSAFLAHPVALKESPAGGFFDDSKKDRFGVSLISTATLQRLAAWFPGLALDELRRRLRTNIEVDGVEPFWEEALIPHAAEAAAASTQRPALAIGPARFAVALSCPRCSVPERNSRTADLDPAFRSRFATMREATLPRFVEPSAYKTMYSVAIRLQSQPLADTAVAPVIAVGDAVQFCSL